MPLALGTSSEENPDDSEAEFVEVDPTGRYGRKKGKGFCLSLIQELIRYRAFDQLEGIEVAWNQIKVAELLRNSEDLERLYSEVHLLKTLKHKNIIKFYNSWVDTKHEHINFITEIFTSGNLRQYRKKHTHVDLRALKKWSRQILEGLLYLHSHDPPVIHRDLKCDNIFVNGNHGEVKIGDLGLAAILHHANAAHSVIGTPEFMAPELYEEEYNELVDIYAFGMCLLELVTLEYPYSECSNAAQIYKKVSLGIKPASLSKLKDPDVKAFIEKCTATVPERLSAIQLLRDPFLSDTDHEAIGSSLHVNVHSSEHQSHKKLEDSHPGPSRDFTVEGERKDINTIFVKLRIPDSTGHVRNIHFPFDIEADTSIAVASEMVQELDLADQDVHTIADMIDSEIRTLIPDWSPRESYGGDSVSDSLVSDSKYEASPHNFSENRDDISPMTNASSVLFPDRLASGRKFWSDSPRSGCGPSPLKPTPMGPSEGYSRNPKDHTFQSSDLRGTLGNNHLVETVEEADDEHEAMTTGDNLTQDDDKTSNAAILDKQSKGNADRREGSGNETKDTCPELIQNIESDKKNLDSKVGESGEHRLLGNKSDDLRTITEKLELLLSEQQKEVDELKRKHEFAVSEFLRELSPEMRLEALKLCSRKIPDYKIYCEMNPCSGQGIQPGSDASPPQGLNKTTMAGTQCGSHLERFKSQLSNVTVNGVCPYPGASVDRIFAHTSTMIGVAISPRFFDVGTPVGNREVGADCPRCEDKLSDSKKESESDMNSSKEEPESDRGIAFVLKHDGSKNP
ncbi:hypothetical protein Cgig2_004113 [Carnegiea gigantea]|uniref:non-specific serine/threonine protein kinase n=1 Tax=Carnegiea gigantea TaxID=171969 RepID=A0A9Q1KUC5_9CARY|nr:hypothetical protein Cgig2_004113 [Carnegiea gigantea]